MSAILVALISPIVVIRFFARNTFSGHAALPCYRISPIKPLRVHALLRVERRHSTFA